MKKPSAERESKVLALFVGEFLKHDTKRTIQAGLQSNMGQIPLNSKFELTAYKLGSIPNRSAEENVLEIYLNLKRDHENNK